MNRTILIVLVALAGVPIEALAHKPVRYHRPSIVLRSAEQFITPSAENKATLYDWQGQEIRSFEVPNRVTALELSSDERMIRVGQWRGPDTFFDVRTGVKVAESNFLPVLEPKTTRFKIEIVSQARLENHMELVEESSGEKVRRLATIRDSRPAQWLANGSAEIPVQMDRDGVEGVGTFLFDPRTGAWAEVFWFPQDNSFVYFEDFVFDSGRLLGVKTWYNLKTVIIDLRTGRKILEIDNTANYQPPPEDLFRLDDFSPLELLAIAIALIVALVLLCWFLYRRFLRYRNKHLSSAEVKDYIEPPQLE